MTWQEYQTGMWTDSNGNRRPIMTGRDDLVQTGMDFLMGAMWYEFNTPHQEIVEVVFGEGLHENYYAEKQEKLQKRGLLFLYGEVDGAGRKRLVEAIFDRYGKKFA